MIRALSERLWLSGLCPPPPTDSALQAGFLHCDTRQPAASVLADFLYLGRERGLCTSFSLKPHIRPDPVTVAGAMPCDHWLESKFLNQLLNHPQANQALGAGMGSESVGHRGL